MGMIIGLVLLALTALLMFFGAAKKVFDNYGIGYWIAFVAVGILIGCAFIPTFDTGAVTLNIAGSIAPIVFSVSFFLLARRTHEVWRGLVAFSVVASTYVATDLLLGLVANATVTTIVAGTLCGGAAYLVGKTRLASLCGVFSGVPIGDIISSAVGVAARGEKFAIGSFAAFDAAVLAAVVAVAIFAAVAAIRRALAERSKTPSPSPFDPDEYKRYFDE